MITQVDGNVYQFPVRAVYECGCGGQTWFVASDGAIICTDCRCETSVIRAERIGAVARKGAIDA